MKISRKKIILSIVIFIFTIGLIGGAVYLKNVGDYKIVGGCPARIIGRRKPGLIITLEPTFLY